MLSLRLPLPLRASGPARRPARVRAVWVLAGVLWLELCALGGFAASSWLRDRLGWTPGTSDPRLAAWRMAQSGRLADLKPGTAAPAFQLRSSAGTLVDGQYLSGRRTVLLFAEDETACKCSTRSLLAAWASEARQTDRPYRIVVVAREVDPELVRQARGMAGDPVVCVDPRGTVAVRFHSGWFPRAFALDERGRVAYVQSAATSDGLAPQAVSQLWAHTPVPPSERSARVAGRPDAGPFPGMPN